MARVNNDIMEGLQGAVGKQVVLRTRNGKTFLSKYPDMSGVKATKQQSKERNLFKDAVAFAQSINNDPAKKAAYKTKKGQTVFNRAIKDYLATHHK
jgi:hypothetical protein